MSNRVFTAAGHARALRPNAHVASAVIGGPPQPLRVRSGDGSGRGSASCPTSADGKHAIGAPMKTQGRGRGHELRLGGAWAGRSAGARVTQPGGAFPASRLHRSPPAPTGAAHFQTLSASSRGPRAGRSSEPFARSPEEACDGVQIGEDRAASAATRSSIVGLVLDQPSSSQTTASVVSSSEAMLAAFSSAERVTLVGSMIPASNRSP